MFFFFAIMPIKKIIPYKFSSICKNCSNICNYEIIMTANCLSIFFIPVSDSSYGQDVWPDFYNAYTASYGSEATALSAAAYNAVYIIQAAAQQAQITPDMPLYDLEDALINAMNKTCDDGIIEHSPENNRSSS